MKNFFISRVVVVVVVVIDQAVTGKASECGSKHTKKNQYDRMLLVQQSMPALKLFTVGDLTSLFGNEFYKFAVLLKKNFLFTVALLSLCGI